ncbi:MAG: tetratricopeptide repeat protein [Planctomycetota bacterium]
MSDKPTSCSKPGGKTPLAESFYDGAYVTRGQIRGSKMGRRRAWVLVGIHVVAFIHILWWKLSDEAPTVSPVEPSEGMYTLASGAINAGAILMLLSLASVLVVGRFFCGWACHLVAIQDGAAWLLRKIGIRPRPLRSKALMWVPLGAGIFLFGMPLFARMWRGLGLPEFSNGLMRADFWETFPGLWLSILTFLICGFGMVYLLGAKGFCTYACPYGGLFGVVDKLATGRIRVNDDCKACGHCSAICTSNVAIADEVKRFGMVVDPGCMKCMDCVSVCPENALRFGFGAPALGAKSKRKAKRISDFKFAEELALVCVFTVAMLILRGFPSEFFPWAGRLYGNLPLLFALGLAILAAFVALFSFRLLSRRDLEFQSWTLKDAGKLRLPGILFGTFALLYGAFLAHSAWYQYHMFRADYAFFQISTDELASRPKGQSISEVDREHIDTARRYFERADDIRLFPDLRPASRLGGLSAAEHKFADAAKHFKRALEINPDFKPGYHELFLMQVAAGQPEKAADTMEKAHELDSRNETILRRLADAQLKVNRYESAQTSLESLLALAPDDASVRAELGSLLLRGARAEEGAEHLRRAVLADPKQFGAASNLGAWYLFKKKDAAAAIPWLQKAVAARPMNIDVRHRLEEALIRNQQRDEARQLMDDTQDVLREESERNPNNADIVFTLAQECARAKKLVEAIVALDRVIEIRPDAARAYDFKGQLLIESGKPEEGEIWKKKALEVQAENAKRTEPK